VDIAQEIDLRYGLGDEKMRRYASFAAALSRSNGVAPDAGTSARSPNGMDATRWRWAVKARASPDAGASPAQPPPELVAAEAPRGWKIKEAAATAHVRQPSCLP